MKIFNFISFIILYLGILYPQDIIQRNKTVDLAEYKIYQPSFSEIYSQPKKFKIDLGIILPALSLSEKEKIKPNSVPEMIGIVRSTGQTIGLDNISNVKLKNNVPTNGGLISITEEQILWNGTIKSIGAKSIRIHFKFNPLPAGVKIYVYNDLGEIYGPYSTNTFGNISELWSNTIFSDYAFIEIQIPKDLLNSNENFNLTIDKIVHNEAPDYNIMADCYENSMCNKANEYGYIEYLRQATAHYHFVSGGGSFICSGGLLTDNRDSDNQPFFLTANHCLDDSAAASSVEAFFDFRTINCGDSVNPNQPRILTASLCGTRSANDFTLLLLGQRVPGPRTYLGWTTENLDPFEVVHLVHHPKGMEQKYSKMRFEAPAPWEICGSRPITEFWYMKILNGQTEGGSSGAVTVNASSQVVGQVLGPCGDFSDRCDFNKYKYTFGKFSSTYPNVSDWINGNKQVTMDFTPDSTFIIDQPSNQTKTITIKIKNSNNPGLNLDITSFYLTGMNYTEFKLLDSLPMTITAGKETSIRIKFTPQSQGTKYCDLKIYHNSNNFPNPYYYYIKATVGNPKPNVDSLSPVRRVITDVPYTLNFYGSGFISGSKIYLKNTNRTATYISSTRLQLTIYPSDVPAVGSYWAFVSNPSPGGGVCNSLNFYIDSANSPVISGFVKDSANNPILNAKITFDNYGTPVYTDSTGFYQKQVAYNYIGNTWPYYDSCTVFSPNHRYYYQLKTSVINQDFIISEKYIPVTGNVKTSGGQNVQGVTITFSNNGGTTQTSSSGFYNIDVPCGWSGTIKPFKIGYSFSPSSITLGPLIMPPVAQNFTATAVSPSVTPSVSSLSSFGSIRIGECSSTKNYLLSAANLSQNLIVMSSSNFAISLNDMDYDTVITLIPINGAITKKEIYVRYCPRVSGSTNGLIRNQSGSTYSDVSVSGNGVKTLSLAQPNGGEVWPVGSSQIIGWTQNGVRTVKMEYSTNNGTSWILIGYYPGGMLGGYSWIIPNTISSQCKVKITDSITTTLTDMSAATFMIVSANWRCIDIPVSSGWNILSIPVTAIYMLADSIFKDKISSAFYYENGYITSDTLKLSKGYWIKLPTQKIYNVCGDKTSVNNISVKSGWNIIGPFDINIPVSGITSNPAGIIASSFFKYNNGYNVADTLKSGAGYWIKCSNNGNLIIPTELNAKPKIKKEEVNGE